tara:strand:- start:30 stop:581 length:552 start_codon:yes stop_codon:yes gene_type:complete
MKIHLGCWHRYIPDWVHVDLCDMEHIDYKTDISDLSCFDDNVADIIYSSHSLEYFDRLEVVDLLSEWRRVLKTGATLRLSVPDFKKLIQVYEQTDDLEKVVGPLYGRMEIDTENGKKLLYHKTVWDEKKLTELLENNGFKNVRLWDWRNTEHADVDDHSQAYFPYMDKENGLMISVNIEADKS